MSFQVQLDTSPEAIQTLIKMIRGCDDYLTTCGITFRKVLSNTSWDHSSPYYWNIDVGEHTYGRLVWMYCFWMLDVNNRTTTYPISASLLNTISLFCEHARGPTVPKTSRPKGGKVKAE